MKNLTLLLIALCISGLSYGQNIKGQILDDSGVPIFFATAALYNASDSTLVAAESTDDEGYFRFEAGDGQYYLTATMLGYADLTTNLQVPASTNENLVMKMVQDANLLTTIEIKDKAPLLEQRGDKLIVNVEGNITNTSGSLLDVMKKVPGMLVIRDRLSIAGSGNPTIYLNGKTTQYMDVQSLLRDMPGDNIKKVEIIHQPGAEYEAAGSGPIINIIMKKNSLFGTNGSVTAGVSYAQLWEYTTGVNLSHYAGKLNVSGGLGFSRNSWVEEIILTRRLNGIASELDGTYEQSNLDQATPRTYRGNVRVDYDLTERNRIGIEAKYYNNNNEWQANNETNVDLFSAESQDFNLSTINDQDRSWRYTSINPYYIFEIDTAGQKLELDLSYANYFRQGNSRLTTSNSINSFLEETNYDQPGETDIYAATIDYTLPITSALEVKVGAKYSEANLDNNLGSEYRNAEGVWINNPLQSNHYLFDESIKAGYGKLIWNDGDWSATAGLRYESSESIGNSLTLGETQTRTINKLFPSFSVSKKLGSSLKSTLSFSRRIDRPRYSTLNPFIFYLDPFTSERGNPNLRPELTNSAKFTLSYEGQPFFNVEYKRSSDAIVEVTEQEQSNQEAYKTEINFDEQTNFSSSLFFPLDFIPGLSGYGGVILSNVSYNSQYIGDEFLRSKWNTTTFIQAEFELPGEIQAELGGWYTSGNQEGIFASEYLYGTSFGISKKFLDRKLKLSLGVEDFINKFWTASVDYQQDVDLEVRWATPQVGIRASYSFGNKHLKKKKKRSASATEELRRAQQN